MEVIKERRRIREKVIKEAFSWTAELPFKATAILIGSYARGDFNLWSDVDILLISEEFKGNPIERLKALDIPPGFQVIPITLNEFKKLLTKRSQLAIEATKHGVILRNDLKLTLQVS